MAKTNRAAKEKKLLYEFSAGIKIQATKRIYEHYKKLVAQNKETK